MFSPASLTVPIPLLRGPEDYSAWFHAVKMACMSKDVWRHALGEVLRPDRGNEGHEVWRVAGQKALTILQSYLAPNMIQVVARCVTSADMLAALNASCFVASLSNKVHMRRGLYRVEQTIGMSCRDITMKIQTLNDQLHHVDFGLQELDLVIILMASLHSRFDPLVGTAA